MRKLGTMDHDECAPWCDHDPSHHSEECDNSFCDGDCAVYAARMRRHSLYSRYQENREID